MAKGWCFDDSVMLCVYAKGHSLKTAISRELQTFCLSFRIQYNADHGAQSPKVGVDSEMLVLMT